MNLSRAKIARACIHTASSQLFSHRVREDRLGPKPVDAAAAAGVRAPPAAINLHACMLSIPFRVT